MSRLTSLRSAGFAALLGAVAASPALAEPVCAPIDALTAGLLKQYREKPVATATTQNSYEVALFRSPDSKTWTLVAVTEDGVGCLLDVGTNWRDLPGNHVSSVQR